MIRLILTLIANLPLICSTEICKVTAEIGRVHFHGKPRDEAMRLLVKTSFCKSLSYQSIASPNMPRKHLLDSTFA
ncbi:hypothetical protein CDR19_02505 [Ectopseudomonas toyotomiensis]|uniref:Uncharacterized protein n=1 Tax=Ectopseudomonas toyotomiensis TaxID=554344 RepID=A0A1I5N6U0_9GAMM|nr:hypothetical protein CDR19_02505 [Pseudomonas toyotomiensis]SFP17312.1 hypothetical protein SAMN05216177_101519 [Pseudomonas toyotomiensis]